MSGITRRTFLERSIRLAALMGLGSTAVPRIAEALDRLASKSDRVLWLQGLSCSGGSVSLMNSDNPGPLKILTGYLSLTFHSTLSTATGALGIEMVNKSIDQGDYCLVVEGSIPKGLPSACKMGEELITDQVLKASKAAKTVIAAGSCASFGGVTAAENNPTGAVSVPAFLKEEHIATPVIAVPGCPVHPDWLLRTLVHVLEFGIPHPDEAGRPKMFLSKLIHDQCPRFSDYERERFAKTFSDEGCLFKLGCLGPITHADCTLQLRNNGVRHCIWAGSPCIGCASENFVLSGSFPLFTKKDTTGTKEG